MDNARLREGHVIGKRERFRERSCSRSPPFPLFLPIDNADLNEATG
jgi:hypothetical protein